MVHHFNGPSPSSNVLISLEKGKCLAVYEHHESAVTKPTVPVLLSDLIKLLYFDSEPVLVTTELFLINQDFLILYQNFERQLSEF